MGLRTRRFSGGGIGLDQVIVQGPLSRSLESLLAELNDDPRSCRVPSLVRCEQGSHRLRQGLGRTSFGYKSEQVTLSTKISSRWSKVHLRSPSGFQDFSLPLGVWGREPVREGLTSPINVFLWNHSRNGLERLYVKGGPVRDTWGSCRVHRSNLVPAPLEVPLRVRGGGRVDGVA